MKMVVGITGASGAIYGIRLLEALRDSGVETHLVLSRWAEATISMETSYELNHVRGLATQYYASGNQAAPISSGSFITDGMVIVPCSMKTVGAIRHGLSDNLLTRAADVTLKEGRPLLLVPRESPLSVIHLENLMDLAKMGVRIVPPMPAFYNRPASVDDIVNHTICRILDQIGIPNDWSSRWQGPPKGPGCGS